MSDNMKKKAKRTILSIDERFNILQRLEAGEVGQKLADEYKVTKAAISLIKKRKKHLLDARNVLETYEGNMEKKRYKGTEDQQFEKQLYTWFVKQRSLGFFISGTILRKQALLFNKRLGRSDSFKASHGWLDAFKKRHCIKYLPVHKKNLCTDSPANEELECNNIETVDTPNIRTDHIYNYDKDGRKSSKMEPPKTFVGKNERMGSDNSSETLENNIPTVEEASSGLKTFIRWYQRFDDSSAPTLQTLQMCYKLAMRQAAAEKT